MIRMGPRWGMDSSEVWRGFRGARRARHFGLELREQKGLLSVRCAHDGYRRLPGRPVHWRQWLLGEGMLSVRDRVEGSSVTAVVRFYLQPDIEAEREGAEGLLRLRGGNR